MIKAVFFDFDETLGLRYRYAYESFVEFITRLTPDMDPIEREAIIQDCMIWDMGGAGGKRFLLDCIRSKYGLPLPEKDDFYVWWNDTCASHMALYDGAEELLRSLKGRYKLACVTNGSARGQYGKIAASGLGPYFDYQICSNDAESRKPDKGIFLNACEHLGVSPEEVLFVGDSFSADIIGAYRLGMRFVWFNPAHRPCGIDIPTISHLSELEKYLDIPE